MTMTMTTTPPKPAKPRAKTAAERQKAYRERRAGEAGEQRINTWVAAAALRYLNALAQRHGLTQKIMLERLILATGPLAAETVEEKPAEYSVNSKKPNTPVAPPTRATSRKTGQTVEAKAKPKVKAKMKPKAKAKDKSKTKPESAARKKLMTPPSPAVPAPAQASLWDDLI